MIGPLSAIRPLIHYSLCFIYNPNLSDCKELNTLSNPFFFLISLNSSIFPAYIFSNISLSTLTSLVRYNLPPYFNTNSSSWSKNENIFLLIGKSRAKVYPSLWKDSRFLFSLPKSFNTARNEPYPFLLIKDNISVNPSKLVSFGSTNWYCVKPLFPYILFQLSIASSG